jgi:hypothetical protein
MKWLLQLTVTSVGFWGATGIGNAASSITSGSNYIVAIYYWPNFHHDAFFQSKKGDGRTEWEIREMFGPAASH